MYNDDNVTEPESDEEEMKKDERIENICGILLIVVPLVFMLLS